MKTKPLKVAIVGFTDSRREAPYYDPDWQIWGMNEVHKFDDIERLDLLLDIHPRTTTDRFDWHVEYLKTATIPIINGNYPGDPNVLQGIYRLAVAIRDTSKFNAQYIGG